MREIKFRAKSGTQWRYGDLYHNEHGELVIYEPKTSGQTLEGKTVDGWRIVIDPETVGQFTGLRDENGREIYEGDIIDVDGEFIAEVVYSGGNYELYTKKEPLGTLSDIAYEYTLSIFDGVEKTFSVVGNIHDNPDLLEKQP